MDVESIRAREGVTAWMQECAQLIATSSVVFRFCQASESNTSRGVTLSGVVSVWDLGAKIGELHKFHYFVSLGHMDGPCAGPACIAVQC